MTPWKPGDPVGCGEAYLPTAKIRLAYALACSAAIIAHMPGRDERRKQIERAPEAHRDELKRLVMEEWTKRQTAAQTQAQG